MKISKKIFFGPLGLMSTANNFQLSVVLVAQELPETETATEFNCNDWEADFDYTDCHMPCASRECNPLFSVEPFQAWPHGEIPDVFMPSQDELEELGMSLEEYVQTQLERVHSFIEDNNDFWCAKDECCPECTEGSKRSKECLLKEMNETLTEEGGVLDQFVAAGALAAEDVDLFIYKAQGDPCGIDCSDLDTVQAAGEACFAANECSCDFPATLTSDLSDFGDAPNTSEAVLMSLEGFSMDYCRAFKSEECSLKSCCPQCEDQIDHAYHCMVEPVNDRVDAIVQGLMDQGAAISNGTDPLGTGNGEYFESDFKCYLWDNYCEPDTCQYQAVEECVPVCVDNCVAMAAQSPRPAEPELDRASMVEASIFSNDTEGLLTNLTQNILIIHEYVTDHCDWTKEMQCRQTSCCPDCKDELDFNFICRTEEVNDDRNLYLLPYLLTGLVVANDTVREEMQNRTGVASLFVVDDFMCDLSDNPCVGFPVGESLTEMESEAASEVATVTKNDETEVSTSKEESISSSASPSRFGGLICALGGLFAYFKLIGFL